MYKEFLQGVQTKQGHFWWKVVCLLILGKAEEILEDIKGTFYFIFASLFMYVQSSYFFAL